MGCENSQLASIQPDNQAIQEEEPFVDPPSKENKPTEMVDDKPRAKSERRQSALLADATNIPQPAVVEKKATLVMVKQERSESTKQIPPQEINEVGPSSHSIQAPPAQEVTKEPAPAPEPTVEVTPEPTPALVAEPVKPESEKVVEPVKPESEKVVEPAQPPSEKVVEPVQPPSEKVVEPAKPESVKAVEEAPETESRVEKEEVERFLQEREGSLINGVVAQ